MDALTLRKFPRLTFRTVLPELEKSNLRLRFIANAGNGVLPAVLFVVFGIIALEKVIRVT